MSEVKKQKCELCGKWVKHIENHKKRHSITNVKCDLCQTIHKNKYALANHIRRQHREPTTTHSCALCSKIFKKKLSLRVSFK